MTRFEYKTVEAPVIRKKRFSMYEFDLEKLNEILRELGGQGWEMVSTLDRAIGGSTTSPIMVFKRAVS